MLLGNRYYDCSVGRFISQDPAQDESNWYSYCGNNPLVATDPSGLDAKVTSHPNEKDKNRIDVSITLYICFASTSDSNTHENRKEMKEAIEQTWSGTFGKYDVKTSVVITDDDVNSNVVLVRDGPGRSNARYEAGTESYWYPNDKVWGDRTMTGMAAHEAGHLMGLKDQYNAKTLLPNPHWGTNIMARTGAPVEERNITRILMFHALPAADQNSRHLQ